METLIHIDQSIFHFINGTLSNVVFDHVFAALRERFIWIPLYLFGVFFLIMNFRRDGWVMVGVLLALVIVTDQSCSHLLKEFIRRYRPCQVPEMHVHLHGGVECGSGFSMPSSHAANHFAVATFIGLLFFNKGSKLLFALLGWASLIGFSQIYVGVHYPFDIVVGAMWGIILGYIAYRICQRFLSKKFYAPPLPAPPRRRRRTHRLIFDQPKSEE